MLGERLRAARTKQGLNQEQVANHLHVKRQTYSAYERNISIPDALSLKRLAELFGVSGDFLLGLKDDPSIEYELDETEENASLRVIRDLFPFLSPENREALTRQARIMKAEQDLEEQRFHYNELIAKGGKPQAWADTQNVPED